MALLWADGFDHYGSDAALHLQGIYGTDWSIDTGNARTGPAAAVNSGFFNSTINFPSGPIAEGYVGYAFKCNSLGNDKRFNFMSAGNSVFSWKVNPDASIGVYLGEANNGTLLFTTAPAVIQLNSYAFIQWHFVCDATGGSIELRVNGVSLNVITDIDIGDTIDGLWFRTANGTVWLDDYTLYDPTGPDNNTWTGDIRCRTTFTEANGANQDWVPVGLPDAFNCVNQVPAQPGTDYITAANVSDLSSFAMQAVPLNTGAIFGVMIHANINKADAGTCEVAVGIGSAGHTAFSSAIAPGTGPTQYSEAFQHDPNGDVPWTVTSVNNVQTIVERVA